jgi:4-amino-4-deoxy-L-arabinose transferase-like glycosyltransferase
MPADAERKRQPPYALLTGLTILASFGVYLAGNDSVPLWDRDEPRYAQCSREMLKGSPEHPGADFVVPRFLGEPRFAKPPFIYWCQAAAMKLFRDSSFAARLPSAVAMPLTLAMLAAALWRRVGAARTFWTIFILSTSVMTLVSAKACLTDSVLLVFITAALLCTYAIWRGQGTWPVFLALGLAVGMAGLTKGPVVLGVIGATLLMLIVLRWLDRDKAPRWLHPASGTSAVPRGAAPDTPAGNVIPYADPRERPSFRTRLLRALRIPGRPLRHARRKPAMGTVVRLFLAAMVVAAVTGPWLYLIQKRQPDFLRTSIGHDVINRVSSGLEGHKGPPGYHLVAVWGTFMPWSLLLPLAIVLGWRRRHLPPVRFAMAAVVGPWLMFEAVQTKLPHYLLPCFPPLAFLTADAIVQCLRGRDPALVRPQFLGAATVWGVIVALLGLAPWMAAGWFKPLPWASMAVVSAFAIAVAAVAVTLFRRRRPAAALGVTGVGMMGLMTLMHLLFLPRAEFLKLSVRAAEVLQRQGATAPGRAVMLDYKEPSLAFYQGGTIREHRATIVTDGVLAGAPPWLVITKEVWEKSPQDARDRVEILATFKGLDIAAGMRVVEVMVLREKGAEEPRSQ